MSDQYTKKDKGLLLDFAKLALLWPYLKTNRRVLFFSLMLVPVIAGLQMAAPLMMRQAIDIGISQKKFDDLTWFAISYFVVVVFSFLARSGQAVLMAAAVYRMIRDLRNKLIQHILSLRARFHDKNLSGVLVTRATSDFDNLSESLNMGILTSIVDLAVLAGSVIGMLILNAKMAIIVIVMLPLTSYLISAFSKALKSATLVSRKKLADLNGFTQESLYAQTDLQILGAESQAVTRFQCLNKQHRDAQMRTVILDAVMFSVIDGISSITLGLFLWLVVSEVYGSIAVSAGILIAFVQYINKVFDPIKNLGQRMAVLQGAFTAIDRIFGLLEVQDFLEGQNEAQEPVGAIQFSKVSFRYDERGEYVLRDVSFAIPHGSKTAIIGRTGSGKSSIIRLLTKLYDGYEGSITLDGQELRTLSGSSLRQWMAIVPQDVVIFSGSIRFNITLGRTGITEQRLREVLDLVGLKDMVGRFAEGLDASLKEQGANLSVGERQLLAFARALVGDPKIIILDEATANIDRESEKLIQKAMDRVFANRTAIIIAHRLKTIESCDQIISMADGKILEIKK